MGEIINIRCGKKGFEIVADVEREALFLAREVRQLTYLVNLNYQLAQHQYAIASNIDGTIRLAQTEGKLIDKIDLVFLRGKASESMKIGGMFCNNAEALLFEREEKEQRLREKVALLNRGA